MSDAEETAPDTREKAVEAEIEKRLSAFNEHRRELLDILRKVHRRGLKAKSRERSIETEAFDDRDAWERVQIVAWSYLQREAKLRQERAGMSNADRVKLLRQLADALSKARHEADKAMKKVCGHWFMEWAELNGNPDLTDPRLCRYEEEFNKTVSRLRSLEKAAYQAAETLRMKRGRPRGKAILPHDYILILEREYRNITKSDAGAGSGPFARFIMEFLGALGRGCTDENVIQAIKAAKKREEKHRATSRWGRDDSL